MIPLPIETQRLRMRSWTREDEPILSVLYTGPEVMRVLGPTGGPELGWALAHEAWGHGYATEAARACIDALFAHTVEEIHHRGRRHVLFEVTRT